MRYAFESLISLNFTHTYFARQSYSGISINPAAETERQLQNHGIIFKRHAAGFHLIFDTLAYGESRSREDCLNAGIDCRFFLNLEDKTFFNYTELPELDLRTTIFHFSNIPLKGSKPKVSIQRGKFANEEDLMSTVDIPDMPFKKPFGLITLRIAEGLPERYDISFKSKESIWRYVLMGDDLMSLAGPAILDHTGTAAFEGPDEIEFKGGKGLAFKSLKPISLSDNIAHNFQLVENYNSETGKYKVVMRALPRADPGMISFMPKHDNTESNNYSEIFIH